MSIVIIVGRDLQSIVIIVGRDPSIYLPPSGPSPSSLRASLLMWLHIGMFSVQIMWAKMTNWVYLYSIADIMVYL